MMRKIAVAMLAAFILVLSPVAASAQVTEIDALKAALADLDAAETVEDFVAAAAAVAAAGEVLREVLPDLDYAALDGAIADLEVAIEGGDLDEITAAGEAVAAAGAGVVAAAEEAAGEEGGDGTEEPSGVATGSAVYTGPNVVLLGVASILALAAGVVLMVRRGVNRR